MQTLTDTALALPHSYPSALDSGAAEATAPPSRKRQSTIAEMAPESAKRARSPVETFMGWPKSSISREGVAIVRPPSFDYSSTGMEKAMAFFKEYGFVLIRGCDIPVKDWKTLLLNDIGSICPDMEDKSLDQLHEGHVPTNTSHGLSRGRIAKGSLRIAANNHPALQNCHRQACAMWARGTDLSFPTHTEDGGAPMIGSFDSIAISIYNRSKRCEGLFPHWDWRERVQPEGPVLAHSKYPVSQSFVALTDLDDHSHSTMIVPKSHVNIHKVQDRLMREESSGNPAAYGTPTKQWFKLDWDMKLPELFEGTIREAGMQVAMKAGELLMFHNVIHGSCRGVLPPRGFDPGRNIARIAVPVSFAPWYWVDKTEKGSRETLATIVNKNSSTHWPAPHLVSAGNGLRWPRKVGKLKSGRTNHPFRDLPPPQPSDLDKEKLETLLKGTVLENKGVTLDNLHHQPVSSLRRLPSEILAKMVHPDLLRCVGMA